MKINPLPSKQYLKECFDYDPLTGILTWRVRPVTHFTSMKYPRERVCASFNGQYAHTQAGVNHYYEDGKPRSIVVKINAVAVIASRIIYNMMVGPIPDGMVIDHKNLDPFDNSWINLRLATQFQNLSILKRICLYRKA